jgi:hypothetical protein
VRLQLIEYPLIHLLLAGIAGYAVARALYSGEVGLNDPATNGARLRSDIGLRSRSAVS